MKLGSVESAFMNNVVRKWFLRHLEAPTFYKALKKKKLNSILEIGCGRGDAIPIHEHFYQPRVHSAFDVDPNLIKRALIKSKALGLNHVRITVGDVRKIDEFDENFDAVFGYGVLHHINSWELGLREISRVLKPYGVYCWEEPFEYFNNLFISKALLSHPKVGMTYRKWMNELEKVYLKCQYAWPIKNSFITLGVSIKEPR